MHVFRAFAAALILLSTHAAQAQDRPRIVAVNHALQYFAERLVGDAAEVLFPVPPEVDPSFWRPSIADISMVQSADLVLLNGAGFATWIDRVSLSRAKLVNTTAAIEDRFIVTESITHSHGDGGQHSHEGLASYTWLDPTLAVAQAEAIAGAILRRNLLPAADVEARLAELRSDLEALDTETRALLDGAQDVTIIATHPRYQYFARRYGLSILSLEWDAGAMPSDAEIAELKALVQGNDARILIWEATPPEAAISVATASNLSGVVFTPLAHRDMDRDFLEAFAGSVTALSDAVKGLASE